MTTTRPLAIGAPTQPASLKKAANESFESSPWWLVPTVLACSNYTVYSVPADQPQSESHFEGRAWPFGDAGLRGATVACSASSTPPEHKTCLSPESRPVLMPYGSASPQLARPSVVPIPYALYSTIRSHVFSPAQSSGLRRRRGPWAFDLAHPPSAPLQDQRV